MCGTTVILSMICLHCHPGYHLQTPVYDIGTFKSAASKMLENGSWGLTNLDGAGWISVRNGVDRLVLERILPGANGCRTGEDAWPHNQIVECLTV